MTKLLIKVVWTNKQEVFLKELFHCPKCNAESTFKFTKSLTFFEFNKEQNFMNVSNAVLNSPEENQLSIFIVQVFMKEKCLLNVFIVAQDLQESEIR